MPGPLSLKYTCQQAAGTEGWGCVSLTRWVCKWVWPQLVFLLLFIPLTRCDYPFEAKEQQQKHNAATSFSRLAFVLNEARTSLASWPPHHHDTEGLWAETPGMRRPHPSRILYPGYICFWTVLGWPCFEAEWPSVCMSSFCGLGLKCVGCRNCTDSRQADHT